MPIAAIFTYGNCWFVNLKFFYFSLAFIQGGEMKKTLEEIKICYRNNAVPEVHRQVKNALISYVNIDNQANEISNNYQHSIDHASASDVLVCAISNFLSSCAILTNLFFSDNRDKNANYKEKLREMFEVDRSNVLYSKTLRNHYTHIEDRILKSSMIGEYPGFEFLIWTLNIEDAKKITKSVNIFKSFLLTEKAIGFGGDFVKINDIKLELVRLEKIALKAYREHCGSKER